MTRDQLTDRITELFPPLAEVEPWDWNETDDDEPVVMIERHPTFTGLESGAIDLTAPIPNTSKIGVWRIEPDNRYNLVGLADDPIAGAAAARAALNKNAGARYWAMSQGRVAPRVKHSLLGDSAILGKVAPHFSNSSC